MSSFHLLQQKSGICPFPPGKGKRTLLSGINHRLHSSTKMKICNLIIDVFLIFFWNNFNKVFFTCIVWSLLVFVCLFINLQMLVAHDESCSVIGMIKLAFTLWQFWSVRWISTCFCAKIFFDAMYLLSYAITLVRKMNLAQNNR